MITEQDIKSLKSEPPKEVLSAIMNDIGQSNDFIGQVVRTHVWAEALVNGIILQKDKENKKILKKAFASRLEYIFKCGIIDETNYKDLCILKKIRNLFVHNIHPYDEALKTMEDFSSYSKEKNILEDVGFPNADTIRKLQETMEKIPNHDKVKNHNNFVKNRPRNNGWQYIRKDFFKTNDISLLSLFESKNLKDVKKV